MPFNSFIRSGIPSLAFTFRYELGSPEEKIRRDWVRDVDNRPSETEDPLDRIQLVAGTGLERATFGLWVTPDKPTWDRPTTRKPLLLGSLTIGGNRRPPRTAHVGHKSVTAEL